MYVSAGFTRPEVTTSQYVLDELGLPEINYDGLSELYYGDLQMPPTEPVHIQLRRLRGSYGRHLLFSNTLSIDPVGIATAEETDLTKVLLHESKHVADAKNHPMMIASSALGSLAAGLGVLAGSYALMRTGTVPDIGKNLTSMVSKDISRIDAGAEEIDLVLSFVASRIGSAINYRYLDACERSALTTENDELLQAKYDDVIKFPLPAA